MTVFHFSTIRWGALPPALSFWSQVRDQTLTRNINSWTEELSLMTSKNVNQIRPQRLVARTILLGSFMFSQCQKFEGMLGISQLKSLLPGETDNKRRLSCRAFNKNIPGSTIEDHWDIRVQCKSDQFVILRT